VSGALFGVGKLLLGPQWLGGVLIAVCIASGFAVWRSIGRIDWSE
jgi:hypothetical protein